MPFISFFFISPSSSPSLSCTFSAADGWWTMTEWGAERRNTPTAANVLETIYTSGLPVWVVIWYQRESICTHFYVCVCVCARAHTNTHVIPNMAVSVGFSMRCIAPVTGAEYYVLVALSECDTKFKGKGDYGRRAAGLLHQPPTHYNAHLFLPKRS